MLVECLSGNALQLPAGLHLCLCLCLCPVSVLSLSLSCLCWIPEIILESSCPVVYVKEGAALLVLSVLRAAAEVNCILGYVAVTRRHNSVY